MRFGARPVLAGITVAVLVLAGAISFRSLTGDGASATALPDACQNLAVVTVDPSALADEVFTLRTPPDDATFRLQEACQSDAGA